MIEPRENIDNLSKSRVCKAILWFLTLLVLCFFFIFIFDNIFFEIKKELDLYIVALVCETFFFSVLVVCVTIHAVKTDKYDLVRIKNLMLYSKIDELQKVCTGDEEKLKDIIEGKKKTAEYYPKNKVLSDIFKVYGNTITEL